MPLTLLMVGVTGAVFTAPVELAFRAAATNACQFAPIGRRRLLGGGAAAVSKHEGEGRTRHARVPSSF
jgi:hypothetical protein